MLRRLWFFFFIGLITLWSTDKRRSYARRDAALHLSLITMSSAGSSTRTPGPWHRVRHTQTGSMQNLRVSMWGGSFLSVFFPSLPKLKFHAGEKKSNMGGGGAVLEGDSECNAVLSLLVSYMRALGHGVCEFVCFWSLSWNISFGVCSHSSVSANTVKLSVWIWGSAMLCSLDQQPAEKTSV